MSLFEIMHGERRIACIDTSGRCRIDDMGFMPYDIYLEDTDEDTDIDTLINNITNFYYWCASRVLTLNRKYAKEILNSIGAAQAVTDRDRAQISLSYHCLSLTDIYWVRRFEEEITFAEVNLFENHLSNAFVDISLRGKQMTVENRHLLADDLSTGGVFPKAWLREAESFRLLIFMPVITIWIHCNIFWNWMDIFLLYDEYSGLSGGEYGQALGKLGIAG